MRGLADMARKTAPGAVVIAFSQFLNDPALDQLLKSLKEGKDVPEVR